jgi:hypothetical protein
MLGIAAALNLADVVLNSVTKASHQRAFTCNVSGSSLFSLFSLFSASRICSARIFSRALTQTHKMSTMMKKQRTLQPLYAHTYILEGTQSRTEAVLVAGCNELNQSAALTCQHGFPEREHFGFGKAEV